MAARLLPILHVSLCGQLAAGHDGNKQRGQALGLAVARANRMLRAAPDADSAEAFQSKLAEEMYSKQEVLTNPGVARALARANSLAEHVVLPSDSLCPRDWNQLCPDGWERLGDTRCSSPRLYTGGCAALQSFASASAAAKAAFASSCKAPWPCREEGCHEGHDYDSCPIGWEPASHGFCKRASEEASDCPDVLKFDGMAVEDVQDTTKACNLRWRCRTACQRDFSAACPEEWVEMSGLCLAPATYAGDCAYSVNASTMSDLQKQAFANKCVVQFPCVEEQTTGQRREKTRAAEVPTTMLSDNGPLDFETGRVVTRRGHGDLEKQRGATQTDARVAQFSGRFVAPSGALDANGDIHF